MDTQEEIRPAVEPESNLLALCRACHDKIHAAEGGVCIKRKHQTDYADVLRTLGGIHVALRDEAAAKNFCASPRLRAGLNSCSRLIGHGVTAERLRAQAIELFEATAPGDLALVERLKQPARLGDAAAQTVLERQFYNRRQITHVIFLETLEELGKTPRA